MLHSASDCDSLASALAVAVELLLQPGLLQNSSARSALIFINAVQAAWPNESSAFGPILNRLSSRMSQGVLYSSALQSLQLCTLDSMAECLMHEYEDSL